MPHQNPARRFQLVMRIDGIARGAAVIRDQLSGCNDDVILEALQRLELEVREVTALARIIADLAPHEAALHPEAPVNLTPAEVQQIDDAQARTAAWESEGGRHV